MISMLKTKPFCQSVKQVDDKKVFRIFIMRMGLLLTTIRVSFNIILLIAFSSVHLMFPGSLWIKNVSFFCASACANLPTSLSHSSGYIFFSAYVVYAGIFCEHTRTAHIQEPFLPRYRLKQVLSHVLVSVKL